MCRAQPSSLLLSLVVLAACASSNPNVVRPTTDVPPSDANDAPDAGAPDAAQDAGVPRVVRVSGGSFAHTCALLSTGRVRCWGANDNGQLGLAVVESRQRCRVPESTPPVSLPCDHTPRDVPDLTDVSDISAGNGGTCALKRDGSVWCWGVNDAGELGQGNNDAAPHATPTRVQLPPARQVAYGAFHVCALLMDGAVHCWGHNKFGQVGMAPAMSEGNCDPGDGITARCHRSPRAVEGLTGVRQITAGRNHSCALLMDGTVRCWGLNDGGQIGNGMVERSESPRPTPTAVMGLTDATQVSAGSSHTCAVRTDGSVHCWGLSDAGQIGATPTTACRSGSQCATTATRVPELTGAASVTAGRFHTCAVLANGGLRCAGRNDEFQLGLGVVGRERCLIVPDTFACTRTFAETSIPPVREVTVGNYHSCALLVDGTVRCWGAGYYGQIGDGATANREGPVATNNLP